MSAGRKTSITRHIDNENIHDGDGRPLPYGSYRAETKNRTSQSRPSLRIRPSAHHGAADLRAQIKEEVENLIVKEVAKRIFESYPKDDPGFNNLENLARAYIGSKASEELFKEFAEFRDGL